MFWANVERPFLTADIRWFLRRVAMKTSAQKKFIENCSLSTSTIHFSLSTIHSSLASYLLHSPSGTRPQNKPCDIWGVTPFQFANLKVQGGRDGFPSLHLLFFDKLSAPITWKSEIEAELKLKTENWKLRADTWPLRADGWKLIADSWELIAVT
jgi:hypothetical protein